MRDAIYGRPLILRQVFEEGDQQLLPFSSLVCLMICYSCSSEPIVGGENKVQRNINFTLKRVINGFKKALSLYCNRFKQKRHDNVSRIVNTK